MTADPPCQPLRRPNYFTGQLLTAADFQAEQDYHRQARQRHNRALHGAGIVDGLEVACTGARVRVSAGLALDCAGREICVPAEAEVALGRARGDMLYVHVAYAERGVEAVPSLNGEAVPSRVEESFTLTVGAAPARHTRRGAGWHACGGEHPLPLARLRRVRGRWQVDANYRALHISP
jgi:hypothetical protein